MSDLLTPAKRQPVTHTYRLGPFTLTVTRRLDTSTAHPRFTWTGTAAHSATDMVLATACHHTGVGESPHDGPDRHDMLARLLLQTLAEDPAAAHHEAVTEATAALRPATYRLPPDPDRPRISSYRLGVFELHLTDHGVLRSGKARSRLWSVRLTRSGVAAEPAHCVYRAHPDRDADSLLLFMLGQYTATPAFPHSVELAAATAALHIATYRDPAPVSDPASCPDSGGASWSRGAAAMSTPPDPPASPRS